MANQNQGNRNQGQGNQNPQGGGNNAQPPEVDLASDDKIGWRFLKNFISMLFNDIGRKGYEFGVIATVLGMIEGLVGEKGLAKFVFPGLAAVIQNPGWLKSLILEVGLPPQINSLIDEAIDDLIEGLRMAYTQRGKMSPADAARVLEETKSRLDKRLSEYTFEDHLFLVKDSDVLIDWMGSLSEEQNKRFAFYKPKLNKAIAVNALIARIAKEPVAANRPAVGLTFLERIYGIPPKPSTVLPTIAAVAGKATDKIGVAVHDFIQDPKQGFRGMAKDIAGTPKERRARDAALQVRRDALAELKKRR